MHGNNEKADLVWERTTRVFHWVNFACVLALAVLGTAILNAKIFGVSSDGKILLKTFHVYVGYVFACNLLWRIVWAFFGHPNSRWRGMLPFYRGYVSDLRQYLSLNKYEEQSEHQGHNPLGRLMVTLLFFLMLTQATTGLVLAGTDLYKPPFGAAIAQWVTGGDADRMANLKPGSKTHVVQANYDDMRVFRKPYITVHLYVFYILLGAIVLHILGVVVAEFRERRSLISAMVTGRKSRRE
jgi:cytochrome b